MATSIFPGWPCRCVMQKANQRVSGITALCVYRVVRVDSDNVGGSLSDAFGEVEAEDQDVVVVLLPERLRSSISDAATEDELWGARLVVVSGLSQPILIGTIPSTESAVEKKTALRRASKPDPVPEAPKG